MNPTKWSRLVTVLLAVAVVGATACSASGSKAGGEAAKVELTLADGYETIRFEPAVGYFIDRVDELSGGQVTIKDVQGWGDLKPDFEQQIVKDVAAGKADLGWTGTRVFDTVGVKSLQALTAPMLIDSYPLEEAVISSPIPDEMLKGLDAINVTGLAVFGDGLRKPISQDHPLVKLSDWKGETFNVFRSKGQTAAIAATGAEPMDDLTGSYTSAERNLLIYKNNYVADFPYVTANVNLWPQTVALFANPDSLSRLTDEQRDWVEQAAEEASARSTGLFDNDEDLVADACERGTHYVQASDADLESLRQAFDGVYANLEQDAQTEDFIEQIETMKAGVDAPELEIPKDCGRTQAKDPLEGEWQTDRLTEGDIVHAFVEAGGSEREGHEFFSQFGGGTEKFVVFRVEFGDGSLVQFESADGGTFFQGDQGAYSLKGESMTFTNSASCTQVYSVDIHGDTLRLRIIEQCPGHDAPYGATIYGSFPFTRVS